MHPRPTLCLFLCIAALCSLGGASRAGAQQLPPSTGGDNPRDRQEYLDAQRRYPFAQIPPAALMQARLAAMAAPRGAFLRSAASSMSSWLSIGPAPINTSPLNAGRISAVAVHPTNANIIYVGAAQGGVWKTTNGGASWAPLTDSQCSLASGSITIDPINPNIVYVGTGEENFSGDSYYGCGILRTTDGGSTWSTLGQSTFQTVSGGAQVGKIFIDPATAGTTSATLFAVSSFGLYKSTNGGTTWAQVLSRGYGYATDLMAPAIAGAPLFAAATSPYTNAANGVYKSFDAGATWTLVSGGLPTASVGRIAFSVSPVNANVMYAAIEDPVTGNLQGLYRTNDGGTTWTSMGATGLNCSGQCWYGITVTASPIDTNIVYFGGLSLYESVDRGVTFTEIGNAIHVDHHALTFDPQSPAVVYAGTDGGIYRSLDAGATWMSLNSNLAITQFYGGISVHPTAASPILGGAQDNGTLEYAGSLPWNWVVGGDGGFTATNPLTPTMRYAETQWTPNSGFSGPRRQDAPGAAFNLVVAGINTADAGLFIPPLALDGAHPSFVYFGTANLYRTKNSGTLWTSIGPVLTSQSGISAIGTAPSDTQVVYLGSSFGQLFVTTNGGTSWTLSTTGLPNRYISDLAVYGARSDIAYVTVSGFGTGHVFKTVNRGGLWSNVSGNLPNVPVNAIVAIPGGELFVGTDLGVYRSADDGVTWGLASTGMPNVAAFDLAYSLPTHTLIAATHGRSMWAATVTPTLAATQVVLDSGATAGLSGTAISARPVVSLREVTGVTVPGLTSSVTAAITAGGGALSGTTVVAAVNGVAAFANLIVTGSGAQTITFTSAGLTSATLTFTPTIPTTLAVAPITHRDTVVAGAVTAHTDSADVTLAGTASATTAWTAAKLKPWTTLTTAGGTGTGRVRWSRNPTGLAAGIFVDTITIAAAGAGGSPIRVFDSLVVRANVAVALIIADTIRGARNDAAAVNLQMDLTALAGSVLGAYNAIVTWDSVIVRLDSVRAVAGGFVSPTVAVLNTRQVQLSASGLTGSSGTFALARLFFRFVSDTNGHRTTIVPAFSVLNSTASADLLPGIIIHNGNAIHVGVLRGDVNGDGVVNAADAQLILQAAVGLPLTPPAVAMQNGDANCNGKLEATDALIVLALVVGLPVTQFCVNTVR